MGTLFVVSTPLGNLKDISYRAIETLFSVDVIACEDTRRTGNLLSILPIHTNITNTTLKKGHMPRLISYHEHNELQRIPEIIALLQGEKNIALVSDAGTPTISDPGFKLIRECRRLGIPVVGIPGPSATILALSISGLPTDKFLFLGYLPQKPGKRKKLFDELFQSFKTSKLIHPTIILFEAPHKLIRTLGELRDVFGDIEVVLCRELTKIHEEVRRETISLALSHFQSTAPKGEFVVLFDPDTI